MSLFLGSQLRNSALSVNLLRSSIFTLCSSFVATMVTSPFISIVDHTDHIFFESLSSGDNIDGDEDLQKDKYKDTQTKTKTNKDPMYAVFFKSNGLKDL